MKKRWIVMVLFVALLCGCSAKSEAQKNKTTEKQEKNIIIDTDYFTLTVPESWRGLFEYEIYPDSESYAYTVNLYETNSHQEMMGGFLFGISLYEEDEDISYLPSYETIGLLEAKGQTYQVIVEYPTDVQFSDDTAANYRKLSKDMDDVIASLKVKEGCTLFKDV